MGAWILIQTLRCPCWSLIHCSVLEKWMAVQSNNDKGTMALSSCLQSDQNRSGKNMSFIFILFLFLLVCLQCITSTEWFKVELRISSYKSLLVKGQTPVLVVVVAVGCFWSSFVKCGCTKELLRRAEENHKDSRSHLPLKLSIFN